VRFYLNRPADLAQCFFFLVGMHGKGKTTLARFLMQFIDQRVETWVLYGGSEGSRALADGAIPPAFCRYGDVTEKELERYIERRRIEVDLATGNGRQPRRQCIVFDDCGASPAFKRAQNCPFTKLVDNMRHLHVSIVMTAQNPNYINPSTLSQVDFLFVMPVRMQEARKTLYDRIFRGNLGTPEGQGFATRDNQRFIAYVERYASRAGCCLVFSQSGSAPVTYYRWPRRFDVMPLGDLQYNRNGKRCGAGRPRRREAVRQYDAELQSILRDGSRLY